MNWNEQPDLKQWAEDLFYLLARTRYTLTSHPTKIAGVTPNKRQFHVQPQRLTLHDTRPYRFDGDEHARTEHLLRALIAHEAAHVQFSDPKPAGLTGDIWNSLEDERIERCMMRRYPALYADFAFIGDVMLERTRLEDRPLKLLNACTAWRFAYDQTAEVRATFTTAYPELWEAEIRPRVEAAWEGSREEVLRLAQEIEALLPEDEREREGTSDEPQADGAGQSEDVQPEEKTEPEREPRPHPTPPRSEPPAEPDPSEPADEDRENHEQSRDAQHAPDDGEAEGDGSEGDGSEADGSETDGSEADGPEANEPTDGAGSKPPATELPDGAVAEGTGEPGTPDDTGQQTPSGSGSESSGPGRSDTDTPSDGTPAGSEGDGEPGDQAHCGGGGHGQNSPGADGEDQEQEGADTPAAAGERGGDRDRDADGDSDGDPDGEANDDTDGDPDPGSEGTADLNAELDPQAQPLDGDRLQAPDEDAAEPRPEDAPPSGGGASFSGQTGPKRELPLDDSVRRAAKPVDTDIEQFARQLAPLLAPPTDPGRARPHRTKGRYSYSRHQQGYERYFEHKREPGKHKRYLIKIATDISGSMQGMNILAAQRAALMLVRAAELGQARIDVLAFNDQTISVGAQDDPPQERMKAIKALSRRVGGGTNVQQVLRYLLIPEARFDEEELLVIISDGQLDPSDQRLCQQLVKDERRLILPILIGEGGSQVDSWKAIFGEAQALSQLDGICLMLKRRIERHRMAEFR